MKSGGWVNNDSFNCITTPPKTFKGTVHPKNAHYVGKMVAIEFHGMSLSHCGSQ